MPLRKGTSEADIAARFRELYADNKKTGKARGANGNPRSRAQIQAIALKGTRRSK